MSKPDVLAFAGSTRSGSFNDKLLAIACGMATEAGANVNHIQLADYPLPLFNQDLEARDGQPENAARLKAMFMDHAGLLLACPEYNSSITPLLKNTIDWVSRQAEGESPLAAYQGKTACLISASPGALGGLRGLRHVREILSNINVLVAPGQFALSQASGAFDTSGSLKDESQAGRLRDCIGSFVSTLTRLADG